MSSGLHLNKETQELIKNIGESRSKQDEDTLIKKDIDKLRKQIQATPYEKMTNTRQVREIAIRAIYADMLGHDVSFTHFFLINMTNSKNLNVKRAGYLACWLLLGEDNDLRIMLVATLQRDLKSESAYEVLIALNSLNKLMNHSNINNLGEDVIKHLGHSNPLIRKKAYCLLQKMIKINPKSVPNWEVKIKEGLGDKEPSVMGVCLNLYYQDLQENPDKHKDIIKILVAIMNLILDVKLPRDYDFQRIPAPWLQIRILQIFGIICQNDKKCSEEVYTVVEKALRRSDDTMTDIGYAVTFQAIKVITKIYANQSLLEKANKTISKFFLPQPPNSKINKINLFYLGIDSIRSLVNINPRYATKHQVHIVDCLQHPDESIRRPTLDLLYKTTNTSNLDVVMDKLLTYLKSTTDDRFKQDLVMKIYELNERLAPNPDWFVKKTNAIFEYGSECVNDNMISRTVKIIEENLATDDSGEFGGLLLQNYYEYLNKPIPSQMVKLISWIFAEVGCRLYSTDMSSLNQLASAILTLSKLRSDCTSSSTKNWILSALAKISSCPGFDNKDVAKFLNDMKESTNAEWRQRAFEYSKLPLGIVNITQIQNYDVNLSFLKPAIVKAIDAGMPKYDPTKLNLSLVIAKQDNAPVELPTTHRQVTIDRDDKTSMNPNAEKKEANEVQNEAEPKLNPKKVWIKKAGAEDAAPHKPEPVKILAQPQDKKAELTEKQQEKVDKRDKVASKLFGGVEEANTLGGKAKETAAKKPTFLKPAAKNAGGAPSGQQTASIDILGGGVSTTTTAPATPKVTQPASDHLLELDLLGGTTTPIATPTQARPQPAAGTNILGSDDLLAGFEPSPSPTQQGKPATATPTATPGGSKFVKPTFKPPVTSTKSLTPFPISEEQYENYWNQFNIEKKDNIKSSNVRTQTEFNQMTKSVGFNITSTIDTDNICAAKFGDKIVLFYGKFKVSGEVEVMLNGNDKEAVDFALDAIRKYCSK
jgi:AP-4 complex subunit epsilon-1